MTQHKSFYGTMFYDSLHFSVNDNMQGMVFSFELDSVGLAAVFKPISENGMTALPAPSFPIATSCAWLNWR